MVKAIKIVSLMYVSTLEELVPYTEIYSQGLLNVGKNMYERTKQNPDLLVVILPQNAEPIRNAVKNFGDVRVGVATQCMVCVNWATNSFVDLFMSEIGQAQKRQ